MEGVVSKRRDAPYRSGACRGWRKVKTVAWREANRERWRLFAVQESHKGVVCAPVGIVANFANQLTVEICLEQDVAVAM